MAAMVSGTITASVANRAQITGLSDVAFTNVDPGSAATAAQNNCVWSNTATKGYSITVDMPPNAPVIPLHLSEIKVVVTPMGDKLRFAGTLELAGFDLGYGGDEAVASAWLQVYRDSDRWFDLYQLAEKLVDLDDAMASWRHKHVLTVERIIGNKQGTGGSAGAAYLRSTLDKRAFPELWSLRTEL